MLFAIGSDMHKLTIILIALILCCPSAQADVAEPIEPQDKPSFNEQFNGMELYRDKCAQCHGELEETRIPDRRPSRIASAIRHVGVMTRLKHLSAMEIIAIAKTLESEDNPLSSN